MDITQADGDRITASQIVVVFVDVVVVAAAVVAREYDGDHFG